MNYERQKPQTRIWWDGNEVEFVRWTERALVFSWGDPHETAIHMPRGAVLRLMEKGVMQIEGELPEWVNFGPLKLVRVEEPQRVVEKEWEVPQPKPAPVVPPAETSRLAKLNIITRLIRKLSSSGPERAKATN